jgi:hypothetical protein
LLPKQKKESKRIPISVIVCAKKRGRKCGYSSTSLNKTTLEIALIDDATQATIPRNFEDFGKQISQYPFSKSGEQLLGNKKYAVNL